MVEQVRQKPDSFEELIKGDRWEYPFPLIDMAAAERCRKKDDQLRETYPEVFFWASRVLHKAVAVPFDKRYDLPWLSTLVGEQLGKSGIIPPAILNNGQVRAIGGIKPIASHLKEMLSDPGVSRQLQRYANGLEMSKISSLFLLKELIETGATDKQASDFLLQLEEKILAKYDKFRCRIEVLTPEMFNMVVELVRKRLSDLAWPWVVAKIIRKIVPYSLLSFNVASMHGYLRISRYGLTADGQETWKRRKVSTYFLPRGQKPSDFVADFIEKTPENHISYAAYHAVLPVYVTVKNNGKRRERGLPLEIQVVPWRPGVRIMFEIAQEILTSEGVVRAKLSANELDSYRRKGIEGIKMWGEK